MTRIYVYCNLHSVATSQYDLNMTISKRKAEINNNSLTICVQLCIHTTYNVQYSLTKLIIFVNYLCFHVLIRNYGISEQRCLTMDYFRLLFHFLLK